MAVPKKKTSKGKRNQRHATWKGKAAVAAKKALSIGGKLLPADQVDVLAKLPTRDQALALLMSVMNAPVTKMVRTLNEVPGKVTRVFAALRDQKREAA